MKDAPFISPLRNVRTKLKETQEQTAKAVGVSRQTIISIERGSYTPSVALALRLAKHFNNNVEDLFIYET